MARHPADVAAFGDEPYRELEDGREAILDELKQRLRADGEDAAFLDDLDTGTLDRLLAATDTD